MVQPENPDIAVIAESRLARTDIEGRISQKLPVRLMQCALDGVDLCRP